MAGIIKKIKQPNAESERTNPLIKDTGAGVRSFGQRILKADQVSLNNSDDSPVILVQTKVEKPNYTNTSTDTPLFMADTPYKYEAIPVRSIQAAYPKQDELVPPAPMPRQRQVADPMDFQPAPIAASALQNTEISNQAPVSDEEISAYRNKRFADIENERKEVLNQAYNEGFKRGLQAGETKTMEKAHEMLQTINSIVTDKNKVLINARGEILKLSLKIAEQILKSEVSLNQAVLINIVSEAISKITDKDKVIIRANRADSEFLRLNKDRLQTIMSDIKNLSIQEDARIEQGGCIIETKMGYIDSTISTKLESIEKALMRVWNEERRAGAL